MVAVLDNFHFDLSSITPEDIQALKPHSNAALSTNSADKTPFIDSGKTATLEDQEECAMEVDQSSSTQPSNKDEEMNKTSAKKILRAIIRTIIPSLQKVLTKRVSS